CDKARATRLCAETPRVVESPLDGVGSQLRVTSCHPRERFMTTMQVEIQRKRGIWAIVDYPGLSLMMFMQYAIWGVWAVQLSNYLQSPVSAGGLGFTGGQLGWVLGLGGAIGAVTAPFIAGQIADRYLNAE